MSTYLPLTSRWLCDLWHMCNSKDKEDKLWCPNWFCEMVNFLFKSRKTTWKDGICENQHLIWIQQGCKGQLVPGRDLAFRPFTVVTSFYRGAVGGRAAENHSLCLTLQQQWLCLEAQPQKSISEWGYRSHVRDEHTDSVCWCYMFSS